MANIYMNTHITYSINLSTGEVFRSYDSKIIAPTQSVDDLDYIAYIKWIDQGNTPETIENPLNE